MVKKIGPLALCLPMATTCVSQLQWTPTVDTCRSSRAQSRGPTTNSPA